MGDATITKIDAANFHEIPTEGIKWWFWADSHNEPPLRGIHLVDNLPDAVPPFATHIWGWGDDQYIRIRVDRSLESGFVAIRLTLSDHTAASANCVVQKNKSSSFLGIFENVLSSATVWVARRKDNPATSVEFISLG